MVHSDVGSQASPTSECTALLRSWFSLCIDSATVVRGLIRGRGWCLAVRRAYCQVWRHDWDKLLHDRWSNHSKANLATQLKQE